MASCKWRYMQWCWYPCILDRQARKREEVRAVVFINFGCGALPQKYSMDLLAATVSALVMMEFSVNEPSCQQCAVQLRGLPHVRTVLATREIASLCIRFQSSSRQDQRTVRAARVALLLRDKKKSRMSSAALSGEKLVSTVFARKEIVPVQGMRKRASLRCALAPELTAP
eukprot:1870574-Pleurochrysis_carterae.AAC.5